MDESNLTIAEYVELLEKRASRRGEVFDQRTANYLNIEEDDPYAYEYEAAFPGIVLNDEPPPLDASKPLGSIYGGIHSEFGFSVSYSDSDDDEFVAQFDEGSLRYKMVPVKYILPGSECDNVDINNKSSSEHITTMPMQIIEEPPNLINKKMDDPNITVGEYIQLMEDKARRHGETFDWQATSYVSMDDDYFDDPNSWELEGGFPGIVLDYVPTSSQDLRTDEEDLDSWEYEELFPAIVYKDASTSSPNVSSESTVSIYNDFQSNINFSKSFSDSEDKDYIDFIIPDHILKPEPVDDNVEINNFRSENIYAKPMDNIICVSNDINPIEFEKNNETNHDTQDKSFTKDFVLMIKIMIDQSFNKRMPTIFLIKNLYVPLGIPFNPKWYYKDGNKIWVRLT